MAEKGRISSLVKRWIAPGFGALLLTGCATTIGQQERFGQARRAKDASACTQSIFGQEVLSLPALLSWGVWVLGLAVSIFAGHFIVRLAAKEIKRYIKIRPQKSPADLRVKAGYIDRAIYTTFFALGQYVVVALWFGIRIVQGIPSNANISGLKAFRREIDKAVNADTLEAVLSLAVGILSGLGVIYLLSKI